MYTGPKSETLELDVPKYRFCMPHAVSPEVSSESDARFESIGRIDKISLLLLGSGLVINSTGTSQAACAVLHVPLKLHRYSVRVSLICWRHVTRIYFMSMLRAVGRDIASVQSNISLSIRQGNVIS